MPQRFLLAFVLAADYPGGVAPLNPGSAMVFHTAIPDC